MMFKLTIFVCFVLTSQVADANVFGRVLSAGKSAYSSVKEGAKTQVGNGVNQLNDATKSLRDVAANQANEKLDGLEKQIDSMKEKALNGYGEITEKVSSVKSGIEGHIDNGLNKVGERITSSLGNNETVMHCSKVVMSELKNKAYDTYHNSYSCATKPLSDAELLAKNISTQGDNMRKKLQEGRKSVLNCMKVDSVKSRAECYVKSLAKATVMTTQEFPPYLGQMLGGVNQIATLRSKVEKCGLDTTYTTIDGMFSSATPKVMECVSEKVGLTSSDEEKSGDKVNSPDDTLANGENGLDKSVGDSTDTNNSENDVNIPSEGNGIVQQPEVHSQGNANFQNNKLESNNIQPAVVRA